MKVLIIANYDLGLYKFRKELIETLLQEGHEVVIALPYGELVDPLVEMGCQFIEITMERRGMNPIKDLGLMLQYHKLLKKVRPNKVITYTIKPNIYGGLISRWHKVPYYANITGLGTAFQREGILKRMITFLYKRALKKAQAVFFENGDNRATFLKHNIISSEQAIGLNGAGINLEEYPYMLMRLEEQLRFLFIGRIMKEKGIEEFFNVAKRIKKEYPYTEFEVVGPYEEDYKSKIEALEQAGIIHYYGYQTDVKPFIKSSHCFVLPSYHEGMANTLLEAAAIGRPLIVSDIPGCREAIDHNGYTVKVQDEEDLYNKIKMYIELDEDTKIVMGMQSRRYMEQKFDKRKIVQKTLDYVEA
ncbi:glycosyltransferase family 4 protein [Niameybacter massiliensis]|uniref:glycosyltransferase family 4 protein n=1 Tax=Niameybacter massiliensis TaxID=1658108 RepID=UPI0006B63DC5|nr:glycosyltransferase family 4 protein [Niameybacter massiliensis]